MIIPVFIPHLGCPHQCAFCDQRTITQVTGGVTPETARLEIESWLKRGPGGGHELAFYGGSFTALDTGLQDTFLEMTVPFRQRGDLQSLRISTRPDAIDRRRLARLKAYGVGRIELGAQSFDDRVLSLCQRGHQVEDIERAAGQIHAAGIALGLQLMLGLPGDSPETDQEGIKRAFQLKATTLRLYPTLVLKGTALADMMAAGRYRPLSLETAVTRTAHMLDAVDVGNGRDGHERMAVIRVGLQDNEGLRGSENVLAGPHHPAFRSLVDTQRFRERLDRDPERFRWHDKTLEVKVHPKEISSFAGYKKSNLVHLRKVYGAASIRLRGDSALAAMTYQMDILDGR